jgi:hypothetical protein
MTKFRWNSGLYWICVVGSYSNISPLLYITRGLFCPDINCLFPLFVDFRLCLMSGPSWQKYNKLITSKQFLPTLIISLEQAFTCSVCGFYNKQIKCADINFVLSHKQRVISFMWRKTWLFYFKIYMELIMHVLATIYWSVYARVRVRIMVLKATFNNISAMWWRLPRQQYEQ